ncbi:MAG: carboxypeptidase-like regulatory domain-containing protein [Candidatus Sulfotelmatobacter sp.]
MLTVLGWAAPQAANVSPAMVPAGGYRIAGTVVSKVDGRPLARARITVRDANDPKKFEFIITSENGKFEFNGVPAGKYSLNGAKRGFISASYDQHDQFSTAIVTGAGLDTENLLLRLAPDAVIAGKVLDEANDPVRQATVTLYFDDHRSGVDQIHQFLAAQTNDLGEYEFTPMRPGTYFLSANGKPWYAIHPHSEPGIAEPGVAESVQHVEAPSMVDRSLDVAYPVTYYPDVTEADDAMPIPIQGGERLELDIHLNPVPSLHILFHVPDDGTHSVYFPRIQQSSFEGYTNFLGNMTNLGSQGVVEVTGIPAGRYNFSVERPEGRVQMDGVAITKDGEEIDISKGEASSSVKFSVRIAGEAKLPEQLSIGLRSGTRTVGVSQLDSKGEAELQQVAAGKYEVLVWGAGKRYSVAHMSLDGAQISGHALSVAAGSSLSVSLTAVTDEAELQGTAMREGKRFAGAMVVLVPKNPEADRDLFRRDQSDLDGTFLLRNVIPGSYTLLAIENGWELDWSQPGVIASYLKRGRKVEIGNQAGARMNVAGAIEVQSK